MICPFCKEEIRDDAIKCRYCSSSLLPPQIDPRPTPSGPAAGPDQVVYIVDQDLIRFGKFAAAVLAVFVAVGIYIYGIDIKDSLKEVETSTKEVGKSADEIKSVKTDVQASEQQVKSEEATLSKMVADTQTYLDTIKKQTEQESQNATAKSSAELKAMASVQKQSSDLLQQVTDTVNQAKEEKAQFELQFATSKPGSAGATAEGSPPPSGSRTANTSFTPLRLADLYRFPAGTDGKGQAVGLIELGGGYRPSDLAAYFSKLSLPMPDVRDVFVDGAKNIPSTAESADGEVQMNIEIIGAVAPAARIVVYFAPNTDEGFTRAISTALHDTTNRISVLAINWGGAEPTWSNADLVKMNNALAGSVAQGVTVLVSSGDNGPAVERPDGKSNVDFPASSPWVTAVGGTRLKVSPSGMPLETPWDDLANNDGASGSGVSGQFTVPPWQASALSSAGMSGLKGRAIPDVSANASPNTGYAVSIDGEATVIGGSTAAASLWAGLIARINEARGLNIGYLNPTLYNKLGPAGVLNSVPTSAPSGSSAPGPAWSLATGWGTPDGERLLAALRQTPSR